MPSVAMDKVRFVGITDYVSNPDIETGSVEGISFIAPSDLSSYASLIEGLLVWHAIVNEELLDAYPKLRFVIRYGVGYDNVDLELLKRRSILFANNPAYGTNEVADSAVALAISLARNISSYHASLVGLPKNSWQENVIKSSKRLTETKVGIYGLGRIGIAAALRFKAFGLRVFAYDPFIQEGLDKALGVTMCSSLIDLSSIVDILSIHCPLTGVTAGSVDSKILHSLGGDGILINTARGPIVDSFKSVLDWLSECPNARAGLDVLPEEPPPLLDLETINIPKFAGRVIINPHTAYYSPEAFVEMRRRVALNAAYFFDTGHLNNVIES